MKKMFVYILKCSADSFYIGVTNNLEMRFVLHVNGINKNCYTFSRQPLEIVFYELFNDASFPIRFEKKLKGWTRAKKIALISSNWERLKELSVCKNQSNYLNLTGNTSTPLCVT